MDCYSQAKIVSVRVRDHLNYYTEPALSSESERRCESSQDRRHCTPTLDLDDRFHPILHHFHHLNQLDLSLSLSGDGFVRLKKDWFKKIISPQLLIENGKLKMKLEDVLKKTNSFV